MTTTSTHPIFKYRSRRKMTLKEFADLVGVQPQAIHRYERGRIPEVAILRRIVEATGGEVTAADFYGAWAAPPPARRGRRPAETAA